LPPQRIKKGQANHAHRPYGIPYESEFQAVGIIFLLRKTR
jgi:hypothetical protein